MAAEEASSKKRRATTTPDEEPSAKRTERMQVYADYFGVQQALKCKFEAFDCMREDVSEDVVRMVDEYHKADKAYGPFRNPFRRIDHIGEDNARRQFGSARQTLQTHESVLENKVKTKKN